MTVDRPVKFSSIFKLMLPPVIDKLPPVSGLPVNLFRLNPKEGLVIATPTVVNPAKVLSCHNFKTPVT